MKKILILSMVIVLISLLVSLYYYEVMPKKVISHWNAQGVADGYSGKGFGLFLVPCIMFVMFFLLVFLPKLDPLRENVKKFENSFHIFILFLFLFFLYLQLLIIFSNLGFKFNMAYMLVPAYAFLSFIMGYLIERAKQNYFIGIRTPWTLANEEVWDKTHHLGGKLFKITGVVILLSLLIPKFSFLIGIGALVLVSLFLVVYSYIIFRNIKKSNKNRARK